uniref:Trichohyalin-plectin-homology domain-containing protein n=1 Tax=Dicentrarchus labrax TaxID=13489 RepID=A0A8P4JZJ8_DICLA
MFSRKVGITKDASLFKARWEMQLAKTEEHLYLHAAEVAGSQGQSQIDKMQTSHQNSRVYEFSSADFRKQIDRDNGALIKLEKRKQVMAENRKHDNIMQSRWENCLKKDQEILLKRSLEKQSVAQYQVSQMKEREVLKQEERLQDQRDGQMLRRLDEQHAQELANQAEQQRESKMRNLKQRLDDIHERHLYAEKQREIIRREEQKARLAQIESEQKLLQRKNEQVERFRRLQVPKQIVYDKLAASKKKQATAVALMEEQRIVKYVVEREAELAKQKKERGETRAAELQSVSAYRKTVIKDKELKKKAEQQRSVGFLQAAKEADRLSLAEEKLKAQKIREERLKVDKVNVSLAGEKHAKLQQQKRDQFSAEKSAESTAVKGSHLQQDVQPEHKKLGRKQRQRLQLSVEDPNKIALGQVLLPPISKAAKDILAANNATRKGFGKFFSGEGSSYLSADTSEPLLRYSKGTIANNSIQFNSIKFSLYSANS